MKIEQLFRRYASVIPDFQDFLASLQVPLKPSFRFNQLKAPAEETARLLQPIRIQPLPYYADGFTVLDPVALGNHFTHQLGLIYGQEASSMMPVLSLAPQPGEIALDLCAAPGSKTTQIAQLMENRGLLVANEVNARRRVSLLQNLKRCGVINAVVIGQRGERIGRYLPDYFDRVLIDAPCSAEGTIRKSRAVLHHWGLKNIERMAWIQKALLVSGFQALKPGGVLIYSTCTVAPEENEGVVDYLLKKQPAADLLDIELPGFRVRRGLRTWDGQIFDVRVEKCSRILPQDNDTAPFFFCRITKQGAAGSGPARPRRIEFNREALQMLNRQFGIAPADLEELAVFLEGEMINIATPEAFAFDQFKTLRRGMELGCVYAHEIKPDNDFVQIFGGRARRNVCPVTTDELHKYLRGERLHKKTEPGFVIISYEGRPIGIGRANGREIKSAVQRQRRIN